MRTPTNNRAVKEAFEAGTPIDRAMNRAFFAAVRLHRMHGIPMALWKDGRVWYADPREIPLSEELEAGAESMRSRMELDGEHDEEGAGGRDRQ
jgi:hypothetical protein